MANPRNTLLLALSGVAALVLVGLGLPGEAAPASLGPPSVDEAGSPVAAPIARLTPFRVLGVADPEPALPGPTLRPMDQRERRGGAVEGWLQWDGVVPRAPATVTLEAVAADPAAVARERVLGPDGGFASLDGRFALRAVASGCYRLRVVAAGHEHCAPPALVTVRDGATVDVGTIALRAARTLHGTVRGEALAPVIGATVSVASGRACLLAQTDASGGFLIDHVPAARVQVAVRAPGFATEELSIDLHHADAPALELVLRAACRVTGTVVADADGQPVADGTVRLCAAPEVCATTDAEGRFTLLAAEAGSCPLAVQAPGFAPWRASLLLPVDAAAPLTVRLVRARQVAGVVHEAGTGAPLAGARVARIAEGAAVAVVVTDAAGRFVLTEAGETSLVRAMHPGHVPVELSVTGSLPVRFELPRCARLRGRVAGGGPDQEVVVRAADGTLRHEPVDADLGFVVEELRPGPCSVWARIAGVAAAAPTETTELVLLPGDDAWLELRGVHPATGALAGRIEWRGRVPTSAYVQLWRGAEPVGGAVALTGEGDFATGALAPGPYRVVLHAASPEHRELLRQDVVVDAGAPTRLVLSVAVGGLRGRVVGAERSPLRACGTVVVLTGTAVTSGVGPPEATRSLVSVPAPAGTSNTVLVTPHTLRLVDGGFQSECLPCGTAAVVVRVPGQAECRVSVEIRAGEVTQVEVVPVR